MYGCVLPIMSDTAPSSLSVVRLLQELHHVTDWYMLVVYLELPPKLIFTGDMVCPAEHVIPCVGVS